MPSKKGLDEKLAELRQLGSGDRSPFLETRLCEALSDRSNHLIALAAGIAADHYMTELEPTMLATFERLMDDPLKRDPGCVALIAIVQSFRQMDLSVEEVYLKAIHHHQLEPVYGGRIDTAAELRAAAALGLVQVNYPDLMLELADLLADSELDARLGAAIAIGYSSHEASVPLLRFKIKSGDADARVMNECFSSLLRLDLERALPLVGSFIQDNTPALAEAAALALGDTGRLECLPLLQDGWRRVEEVSIGRAILMAVAMLRVRPAYEFLLTVLQEAPVYQAVSSLEALGMARHDSDLWASVRDIVEGRGDEELLLALTSTGS